MRFIEISFTKPCHKHFKRWAIPNAIPVSPEFPQLVVQRKPVQTAGQGFGHSTGFGVLFLGGSVITQCYFSYYE